jgi:hypothetical protein
MGNEERRGESGIHLSDEDEKRRYGLMGKMP